MNSVMAGVTGTPCPAYLCMQQGIHSAGGYSRSISDLRETAALVNLPGGGRDPNYIQPTSVLMSEARAWAHSVFTLASVFSQLANRLA